MSEKRQRIAIVGTGFIVYNKHTYPYFCKLMEELGVATQDSNMSFSVKGRTSGLEYCGTNIQTVFAQRSNLLKPWFYKMLIEIFRFHREGNAILRAGTHGGFSLGRYLEEGKYSRKFQDYYILPMGAAIWSTPAAKMLEFPLHSFLLFLANHGMLGVNTNFQWRTITGGSREYGKRITAPYQDRILYDSGVKEVHRESQGVRIVTEDGRELRFDQVVMATHADITLRLLADATPKEKDLLSLFADRTYFCGAYCGYGFHEDGLRSAVTVARHFGVEF